MQRGKAPTLSLSELQPAQHPLPATQPLHSELARSLARVRRTGECGFTNHARFPHAEQRFLRVRVSAQTAMLCVSTLTH
jgi:hypothetical protein